MESESDPLTRRAVDLFEKEPLKGNSEVHLHTPTKFGEDRSKDLGGDREQTDRQTNRQTDKRCSIYSMILTLPYNTHQTYEYFWIKHDLGQKYYAQGLNSRPSDNDSTFHVTGTPALTTWPSVTSKPGTFKLIALCAKYY